MRHFLLVSLPGTIAPCTLGMLAATAVARLIAPPGSALFATPVLPRAALLTVDVAAVATGADQHLLEAACAEKQARGCICLFAVVAQTWTKAPAGWDTDPANVPRHVVGRGADANCQVVIGVAPVFNKDRPLAHLLPHSV